MVFKDRIEAGRLLAEKIGSCPGNCTVTGIARGGILVARPISEYLGKPLTSIIVKKIGHPSDPEFAIGSVAEGMERRPYLNAFSSGVDQETIQYTLSRNIAEIEDLRKILGRKNSVFSGKWDKVILVDDGSATGTTVVAAVRSIMARITKNITVALPVISEDAFDVIRSEGVEVLYLEMPYDFQAVSEFYIDFHEVTIGEIGPMLDHA